MTSNRHVNVRQISDPEIAAVRADSGLSACIITFNEADRIADCIRSVSFCDDILVVDSGSTDATVEIARSCGARVLLRAWTGYRSQKQFAVDQANHHHVLSLDADERVTPPLRAEIEALRERGFEGSSGWTIPRLTEYCGRFLRHGNSYPDRAVRLFDRRVSKWSGYEVHESIRTDGSVGELSGHLEHFSYRNLDDHLARMHRYAVLMADEMFRAGKRRGFGTVLINPAWRFLRGMILKRGFLDGWRGLAFHLIEARYVREKYLRAWLATRSEGRAFVRGSAAAKPGSEAPHAGTQPALRRTAL